RLQLLRAEEPLRRRALADAVAAGGPWRVAWAEARRGLDLARLQEALRRWLSAGAFPTELHRFAAPANSIDEQPLAPWGVHVALAELWSAGISDADPTERAARVRTELAAAAAASPEEALPRVLLAELETDPDRRRALAERLRAAYPRSPDAAVLLARVLRDQGGPLDGRRATMLDAMLLAPDDADALTAHALEEARAGDFNRAFAALRRAETAAPWSPTVHVARANILASAGECQDASDAVQRGLDVLADAPPPEEVTALVRERARLEASCRPRLRP
ncbi:MAG TPA: hypothetical protein VLQ79_09485, partial [Myxococcaceae bacterium]|nr:hypothetical protein [Myxococcaceae bacterium]